MTAMSSYQKDQPILFATAKLLLRYWFFAIPFLIVARFLFSRYSSSLRKYPGPLLASGSRAWKVWSTWSGHTELDHISIHEQYGPIVRIAPHELSFASVTAAREILSAGKGYRKTDFYGVFPPPEQPDIFTETREEVHAVKKRYTSHPYSMATMQTMASYIEDTQRVLTRKLDGFCEKEDNLCNLGDYLHYFAFDVLGEIAFSRTFGFLEAGYDVEGAIKTIDNSQWYNGLIGSIPEWDFVFRRNPLWKLIPSLNTKNLPITRMALEELEKRKRLGKETGRKDLLSQLFDAHEKAPDTFKEADVFAVAHGAIFAGSDSTASTMQSFCWHVLRDPHVYNKLKNEIDEAASSGRLSEMPQWNEVQSLPYFQACLKEAMRIRPAVGLNITRHVPAAGAQIDGQNIPGNTRVALNGWVLHRDTSMFGADAKVFRPERFLEGDAKAMERSMFQFGGGSHLCIGKNLALLEMNKTLPLLFRDYDLELVRPEDELKYHTTFFVVQKGPYVRISKRGKV